MIRVLFFILTSSLVFSQEINYKYSGEPYYPEQILNNQDSLVWPIVFDVSIDVKDIKGLDEKRHEFFSKLVVSSFSKYDLEYITNTGDTINLAPEEFFDLHTKKNSLTTNSATEPNYYLKKDYNYLFYDSFNLDFGIEIKKTLKMKDKLQTTLLIFAGINLNYNYRRYNNL